MSTKKNSVVSQALVEMDEIVSAIKEESKKSLNAMLKESVRDALREGCCDEDDDYEVLDGEDKGKKDAENKEEKDSKKSAKSDVDENGFNNPANQPQDEKPQPEVGAADAAAAEGGSFNEPGGNEAPEASAEGGDEEGFDEFSEYNVGDNAYDLSGEKDLNKAIKIYKLLNNDDKVVVKMEDNQVHLTDNEANTEYVIDLGEGGDNVEAAAVDNEGANIPQDGALNEGTDDIAGLPSDDEIDSAEGDETSFGDGSEFDPIPGGDDEGDVDSQMNDMYDAFGNRNVNDYNGMSMAAQSDDATEAFKGQTYAGTGVETTSNMMDKINSLQSELDQLKSKSGNQMMENKSKKARKPMKESKEVLFEVDLGYTDNYQDKDPIKGLSNNEPSKSGKSWHKGVPTGTEKPWAGDSKSKGAPFSKTQKVEGSVNEMDNFDDGLNNTPEIGGEAPVAEGTNVGGAVQQRTSSKSHIPAGRKDFGPKVKRHVSAGADYQEIVNEMKAIKQENKELKEALVTLRKNLNEAYITNVNLGKITKLFLENATSQQEKIDIVNRFSNEAKTVEQSKSLYESISKQLKKNDKTISINESSATAKGTQALNEQKVYKSNDLMKTIDLMNRMSNC